MSGSTDASKIPNLFTGRLVRLRPPEARDYEASRPHDFDSELQRLGWQIEGGRSDERARQWWQEQAVAVPDGDRRRFSIETLAGELVGGMSVIDSEPRHGTFGYGLALFRPYWRQGYGSDAVRVLLRFYFGELRYQKVLARVYAYNAGSIAMHRALGFVEGGPATAHALHRRRVPRRVAVRHDRRGIRHAPARVRPAYPRRRVSGDMRAHEGGADPGRLRAKRG
ncbi:MAG: GNAT family N-acetyltransferase [Dehalococcoidia bacterium]